MPQPVCEKCGKAIEPGQSFVRTGYDEAGKMTVIHFEENTDATLKARRMNEARMWAIETYVAPHQESE